MNLQPLFDVAIPAAERVSLRDQASMEAWESARSALEAAGWTPKGSDDGREEMRRMGADRRARGFPAYPGDPRAPR